MIVFSNHALRHSGGIERYLLTLVDGLHRRGVRPTVVARRFDTTLPEYGWVDPVRIRTCGLGGALRDRWFDWRLRRLQRQHGWHPLIALNQTGAADIAVCGGTHPGYLAAIGKTASWRDRLAIMLERRHLENAAVVIAHSGLMAAQVQAFYGIPAAKIEVLYPPVDTQRFHPVCAEQRRVLQHVSDLDRCRESARRELQHATRRGVDRRGAREGTAAVMPASAARGCAATRRPRPASRADGHAQPEPQQIGRPAFADDRQPVAVALQKWQCRHGHHRVADPVAQPDQDDRTDLVVRHLARPAAQGLRVGGGGGVLGALPNHILR